MKTLHLVSNSLREVAAQLPQFELGEGDIETFRTAMARAFESRYGPSEGVGKEEVSIPSASGAPAVTAFLYRPGPREDVVPAIIHMHGGAWVGGAASHMASHCAALAARHGAVVLSVDYRLAPETPFPGPFNDCCTAFDWLIENAGRLGVDPNRVAVMGDSAGGNLAAAVALRNRDERQVPLKAQFLIYPALDERTGTSSAPKDNPWTGEFVVSRDFMRAAWPLRKWNRAVDVVPERYFSPSLASDLSMLPPTYMVVGSLDLFLEEDAEYALRLARAGVSVEFHVYDGLFHGFDLIAGEVADRFLSDLDRAIVRLLK